MSPVVGLLRHGTKAIRHLGAAAVAALAIAVITPYPAVAHDNGGGSSHGSGGHGSGGSWHGGGWHGDHWSHGWHGGNFGWGWTPGFSAYDAPAYPYPYPYPYAAPYSPPVYAAPGAVANTWYYCRDPAGYYPYVPQCARAWQPVPAQPPS